MLRFDVFVSPLYFCAPTRVRVLGEGKKGGGKYEGSTLVYEEKEVGL